jgi:hypothetical protein
VGGTSDFGPGGRTWQTLSLAAGSYVMMCDMHADSGQVGTFVVRETTGTR